MWERKDKRTWKKRRAARANQRGRRALSAATWLCAATHSIQPWTSGNTAPSAGRLVPTVPAPMPVRRRLSPRPRVPPTMIAPSPGDGFLPSDPPPIVFISLRPPSLRDRTHTQRIVPSHTACHHVARNPSVAAILRRGFRNFVCSSSTDQGQLPSALLLLQSALVYVNTCSKKFSVFSPLTIEFLLDSHSLVVFFLILYYFICSVRGLSRHALYAFHAFYACSSGVSHPKIIQLI